MADDDIYEYWNEFIQESPYNYYFTDFSIEWFETLNNVKKYIDTYDTRPFQRSKHLTEKKLGTWLDEQTKNGKLRKQLMSDDNIYESWVEFIQDPKYSKCFSDSSKKWFNKLEKVKEYIDEFNAVPTNYSTDTNTKKLGYWLTHHERLAKRRKEIMRDEYIYERWLVFINDPKYSKYFK